MTILHQLKYSVPSENREKIVYPYLGPSLIELLAAHESNAKGFDIGCFDLEKAEAANKFLSSKKPLEATNGTNVNFQDSMYCAVEFGSGRVEGLFIKSSLLSNIKELDYVIVEGDRGIDLGRVIELDLSKNKAKMINKKGPKSFRRVLRLATRKEIKRYWKNIIMASQAVNICQKEIDRQKLPVDLVNAEYQWDQEKITFFFNAKTRVDFRQLVVFLYTKFQARIWMCNLQFSRYKIDNNENKQGKNEIDNQSIEE